MKQESKEKILNFLIKNKGTRYSIRQIHLALKISYPTAQRAVATLDAEGKINLEDRGNSKLVWYKE